MEATITSNRSDTPLELGALTGLRDDILDPEVIAAHAGDTGIRLWLIKADSWRIRCTSDDRCEEGRWYEFMNFQLIVDTEAEAEWVTEWGTRIYKEPVVFRDDLPRPLSCLACHAQGKRWDTQCLAMYQAHMFLDHAG